jgi:hypothetical protein
MFGRDVPKDVVPWPETSNGGCFLKFKKLYLKHSNEIRIKNLDIDHYEI